MKYVREPFNNIVYLVDEAPLFSLWMQFDSIQVNNEFPWALTFSSCKWKWNLHEYADQHGKMCLGTFSSLNDWYMQTSVQDSTRGMEHLSHCKNNVFELLLEHKSASH